MSFEKPHLLIVGDSEPVSYALQRYFEDGGYYVTTISNDTAALEIGKEICIHGLITDVRMYKADGLEVIRSIRAHQPNLPVIIVSANIAELDLLEDKHTQVFGKPMNMYELLTCMNIMLSKVAARF